MHGHVALSIRNKLKFINIFVKCELEKELVEQIGLRFIENTDFSEKNNLSVAVIENASVYLPIPCE